MTALVCPHCGVLANFRYEWSPNSTDARFRHAPPFVCFSCDNCQYPVVGITIDPSSGKIGTYWPTAAGKKDFPDVPEPVATSASEAHVSLAAGSPRGAVALARAVVESVAKEKGITTGNLQSKIDKLCNDGYISEAMKEAANEIRFAGNEAAHGDLVTEPLTPEDAGEIVSLMDTILERVYQEPAQVARIRQQREERKARQVPVQKDVPDEPPF
jgi:Domain of unknown function (DUF4145)